VPDPERKGVGVVGCCGSSCASGIWWWSSSAVDIGLKDSYFGVAVGSLLMTVVSSTTTKPVGGGPMSTKISFFDIMMVVWFCL